MGVRRLFPFSLFLFDAGSGCLVGRLFPFSLFLFDAGSGCLLLRTFWFCFYCCFGNVESNFTEKRGASHH